MQLFNHCFLLFALLGLVAAKKPEDRRSWVVIHQLDIIQKETQQLNTALDKWDKTMFGALLISEQTEKLLRATRNASSTIATKSRNIHLFGALHVKRNTKHLMKDISTTVGHIGSLIEDFQKVGVAQTVVDSLIEQQTASGDMNDAVLPKLPLIAWPAGRKLRRQINGIFQVTIDEYKKKLAETETALPAAKVGQRFKA